MATKKRSKKRRRRQPRGKAQRGVFTRMRSGFKNLAQTEKESSSKSSLLNTLVTIALIIAAAAILYSRS
jgi:hypothetical protein